MSILAIGKIKGHTFLIRSVRLLFRIPLYYGLKGFRTVADDLALDHVYGILRDVGGMVCNSLQVSGGGQEMYQALHPVFVFLMLVWTCMKISLSIASTSSSEAQTSQAKPTVHVYQGVEAPLDHRLGLFRQ